MKDTARQALFLAEKHLGKGDMVSSARLCVEDSRSLFEKGDFKNAAGRALDSLSYSVGVFHPDHVSCKETLSS